MIKDFYLTFLFVVLVSVNFFNGSASPLTLTVLPDSLGHSVPSNFVGLSFEASQIGSTIQFNISDSSMIMLLRQIGPGVIRIGGNSVDKDTMPFDSIRYDRFYSFVNKSGWKLMQGLTLGTFDTSKAIQVAELAMSSIQTNLYTFEVGNEPDLFSKNGLRAITYSLSDYESDFEAYENAIHEHLPNAPFSGPTTASSTSSWVVPFAEREASNIVLLTQHYYAEGPAGDSTVTMAKLLSRATKASLLKSMALTYNAAQTAHVPARVSECNSVYNGGQKGLSDVFGASLWTSDFMFSLANGGISGVNFHGGDTGNYTPIAVSLNGNVSVRPEYYGIMLFKYAASGQFVRSMVSDTLANIGAYALNCNNDSMRIVLINKDSSSAYEVTVTGTPFKGPASVIRLSAPSLLSTTGLSLGGDSIGTVRAWAPSIFETIQHASNGYLVTLPAASAAVLTMKNQSLVKIPMQVAKSPVNIRVANGWLFIRASPAGHVRIALFSVDGKALVTKDMQSDGNQMQISLPAKTKSGVYILSVIIDDESEARMVLP